jgi:predicted ATPase
LPRYGTSFVGREALVEAVSTAFAQGVAWQTLLGPPGVGKTRLAVAVAHRRREAGARIRFFDLRDAAGPDDLLETIASGAAYVVSTTDRLLQRLEEHDPDELWVLDNCETVLAAVGALVPRLLAHGRRLQLLLTSRERIPRPPRHRAGAGERVTVVPLLAPGPTQALLFDRARATGVPVDEAGWRAAGEHLSASIEGLPLAVELVAAQLDLLHPRDLAERLGRGGPLDLLSEEIGASLDRLDPAWRELAIDCAVFRGGFDAETAARVLQRPVEEVRRGIARLRAASLLVREPNPDGPLRFSFLHVVRSHLEARSEREDLRRRHLAYFAEQAFRRLRLAEERDAGVHDAWLDRELDNLKAAFAFASDAADGEARLELALAMSPALVGRGAFDRAARQLENGLAAGVGGEAEVRARVELAQVERSRGHLEAALAQVEAALDASPTRDDGRLELLARRMLAFVIYMRGDFERASEELDRAIAAGEGAGAPLLVARTRGSGAGIDIAAGRLQRARDRLGTAIEAAKRLNDPSGLGLARARLALVEHQEGRVRESAELIRAALLDLAADRDTMMEGRFRLSSSLILGELGELEEARANLAQAEECFRRAGARRESALAQHAQATLLARAGEGIGEAAALCEASARTLAELGDRANAALARATAAWLSAQRGEERAAREHASIVRCELGGAGSPEVREAVRIYLEGMDALLDSTPTALTSEHTEFDARNALWLVRRGLEGLGRRDRLRIRRDGTAFEAPDGQRVDVSRRVAIRRILSELVRADGAPRASSELIEAGWPGERVKPEAATARLYVALSSLRKLGMSEVLARCPEGYHLAPGRFAIVEEL